MPSTNHYINEELCYDATRLLTESKTMVSQLNDEQLDAFNCIIDAVLTNSPKFFFVSIYEGTGKTFLWNTIITHLRSKKLYYV
jgi:hypothetical protein